MAFEMVKWINENYTGEGILGRVIVLFAVIASVFWSFYGLRAGVFVFFIGVTIVANFYVVLQIQRWYVSKKQKEMEDYDYGKIIDYDETVDIEEP